MLSVPCVRGVTKLLSVQFAWTQLWNPPQRNQRHSHLLWVGSRGRWCLFYWGRFKEDSVYCRPGNKEIKIDMLKKKRNQHLFSDKAEKPETFAWTPSMSVYSWPQINLSGKYNPPLYHLSLLIPAYEHTRMPTSGDSQQPMKDKCFVSFFSLSCMKMEDKKTVPACRRLSVHLLVLHIAFFLTLWHIEASQT